MTLSKLPHISAPLFPFPYCSYDLHTFQGRLSIKWQPLLLWRVCDAGETAWDLPAGPSSTTELDKRCDFEKITQLLRASESPSQGAVLLWGLDEMICTEGLTQARRLGSAPHKEAIDVFGFLPGIVSCRELVLMIWNSRKTWCIDLAVLLLIISPSLKIR